MTITGKFKMSKTNEIQNQLKKLKDLYCLIKNQPNLSIRIISS